MPVRNAAGEGAGGGGADLDRSRRVASEALMEHFAAEHMSLEEFERRVDAVRDAGSVEAVRAVLVGLPGRGGGEGGGHPMPTRTGEIGEPVALVHAWGSAREPDVPWRPARTVWVVGVLGRVRVDFSGARLPPGVTDVRLVCGAGGAEILVPQGVAVDVRVPSVAGHVDVDPTLGEPSGGAEGGPVLRIRGLAVAGAVRVREMEP